MTSITWAGPRCVQELATILAPQNRIQGHCGQQPNEGSWTALGAWTDGSPWCFQSWLEGEPNDDGGLEDFAQINWGGLGNGKWNDQESKEKFGYFCQK